ATRLRAVPLGDPASRECVGRAVGPRRPAGPDAIPRGHGSQRGPPPGAVRARPSSPEARASHVASACRATLGRWNADAGDGVAAGAGSPRPVFRVMRRIRLGIGARVQAQPIVDLRGLGGPAPAGAPSPAPPPADART